MSFASRIKEELVRQRVREPRLKNAQLSGLTFACGSLKLGRRRSLVYRTENEEVARHIASLSASLYKLEITVERRSSSIGGRPCMWCVWKGRLLWNCCWGQASWKKQKAPCICAEVCLRD